ncbi:Spy/CpxP family protein refolding chaperone [Zavarzinia sp.]|uniref:Spy/CpxP family protein refolding chaperone n=1 Tax=Zavarzinia sp. TaxID=2027920 RepID=UPI00356B0B6E
MNRGKLAAFGLLAALGSVALGAGTALAADAAAPQSHPAARRTPPTPEAMAERCQDRYARDVSRVTYLETRLAPTDAQKSLWQAYKAAAQAADAKARDACLAAVPKADGAAARPSLVDRQASRIAMLTAQLENLKATQPALAALYPTLSDAQKQILDGPRHGGPMAAGYRPDHRHHGRGTDVPPPDGPAPDAPPPDAPQAQ